MSKLQKFFALPAMFALILVGGAIAGYTGLASADEVTASTATGTMTFEKRVGMFVAGSVASINGTTLTVTADKHAPNAGTVFTVDASSATWTKSGATASSASFATGDKVFVEGAITGTNVVATKVSDKPEFRMGGHGKGGFIMKGQGVMGKVTAVNGSTVTLTGRDGQTFTVEAGSATVEKMVTGSLSDVSVGDTIGVAGTVSGTSVTATKISAKLPVPVDPTIAQ